MFFCFEGVAGGFIAPHEARLLDAFSLGKTVRLLAILDGVILVINCAYFPLNLLLLLWVSQSLGRTIFVGKGKHSIATIHLKSSFCATIWCSFLVAALLMCASFLAQLRPFLCIPLAHPARCLFVLAKYLPRRGKVLVAWAAAVVDGALM